MAEPTGGGPGELRVGAPMWAHPPWAGTLFPDDADPLATYATWCTAVEGNTTFYATPASDTVRRWAESLVDAPWFRFCFKVPRSITHERRLRHADEDLALFLAALDPVAAHLGPVQIQLPASFSPDDLDVLVGFCDRLPHLDHQWAVEVRHPGFFPGGRHERPLNDALAARGINRVLLDSRTFFAGPVATEAEQHAFHAKPRVPVRPVATGTSPIVRFIGRTDPEATAEGWRQWPPKVVEWLDAGLDPYVFIHTPDNAESPILNRRFHREVRTLRPHLDPLPEPIRADTQLDLF